MPRERETPDRERERLVEAIELATPEYDEAYAAVQRIEEDLEQARDRHAYVRNTLLAAQRALTAYDKEHAK